MSPHPIVFRSSLAVGTVVLTAALAILIVAVSAARASIATTQAPGPGEYRYEMTLIDEVGGSPLAGANLLCYSLDYGSAVDVTEEYMESSGTGQSLPEDSAISQLLVARDWYRAYQTDASGKAIITYDESELYWILGDPMELAYVQCSVNLDTAPPALIDIGNGEQHLASHGEQLIQFERFNSQHPSIDPADSETITFLSDIADEARQQVNTVALEHISALESPLETLDRLRDMEEFEYADAVEAIYEENTK